MLLLCWVVRGCPYDMGPQETDCSNSGLCNDTQHGGEKPLFLKDLFLLQEMPSGFRDLHTTWDSKI